MSVKNDLRHSLLCFGDTPTASHSTKDRRQITINAFVKIINPRFNQCRSVWHLKGRHLIYYVEQRLAAGVTKPTLQTEMSHLRQILREAGMHRLCANQNLTNKALGISTPPGGRSGSFKPIRNAVTLAVLEKQAAEKRPGVALALLLQRTIGLRLEEAVQSSEHVLALWMRQLEQKYGSDPIYLDVYRGTKNKRCRSVRIFRPDHVIAVVEAARKCARNNGGFLITDGDTGELLDLKRAKKSYSAFACRSKIQTHAARYAFACNQYAEYRDIGYTHKEALAALAENLGHGDHRGEYVRRYYVQDRHIYKDRVDQLLEQVPQYVWNN